MKKIYILLCALAALAAASCTEKEELAPSFTGEKVTREFSTVLTKTTLHTDGATVYWEDTDAISIFDGTSNNKFDIKDYTSPSSSATFSGEVDAGATSFYAVYPYAAGNALAGSTLTAEVPATQTLKADSFQSGAAVAVAYTTGNSLAFHQATAILGITLDSDMDNVESIEFYGNNNEYVAGAVDVAMNTSNGAITSVTPGTGSKKVTLTGSFSAGETYYLSFIPQTFSNGVTVLVNFDGDKTGIVTSDKELNTVAGMSYPIANFTRVTLPKIGLLDKYSFNYDEGSVQNLVPESSANIASITVDSAPAGWEIAWNTNLFEVTPPTQNEIQATPQTVVPEGVFEVTLRSAAGHTRQVEIPVRLKGINSLTDWNAFRTAYGPANSGIGAYSAGTSYSARGTAAADYMVDDEITLNADIALESVTNYYFHNIEHNINGNNRTLTVNVKGSAWPIGFCQQTYGNPTIHDLNLAGTVAWTYKNGSDTKNNAVASAFAARVLGESLTFTNVNSSVNITWTSSIAATPKIGTEPNEQKHGSVGGLVGMCDGKTLTFNNCEVSGTISQNTRALGLAGFLGWNAGANKVYFNHCTFSGKLVNTVTSADRSAYTANSTLDMIGGFVGASDGNASALIQIKGSAMSGEITVADGARMLGGFVGKASSPLVIADDDLGNHSMFSGKIDYTDALGVVASPEYGFVGGFVGGKTAQATTITNCVSAPESEVKITGGAQCVGGYIGKNESAFVKFKDNIFGGKVIYYSKEKPVSSSIERVGGFVGYMGGGESTFDTCHSNGTITVTQGAISVGGFCGIDAGLGGAGESVDDDQHTYDSCDFGGTLDFSSYNSGTAANTCGRIGGFVGELLYNTVYFNSCNVTSGGKIISNKDISNSAGFLGNGGGTYNEKGGTANKYRGTAIFNNCQFHGTLTHTSSGTVTGARRVGGFVGDASRVVSLTSCSNDGNIVLHENAKGFVGLGGIIGRTTNAVSGHTMSCTLTSCSFSGSMTVYAPNESSKTNLSGKTNIFGTLIGANAATTAGVLKIDGANYTSNTNNNNYGTTSVTFAVEP